jgi:hypothetical protein
LYFTYSNEYLYTPYSASSSRSYVTSNESDRIDFVEHDYGTWDFTISATGSHGEYYTYNTNSLMTYPEATVIRSVTRV